MVDGRTREGDRARDRERDRARTDGRTRQRADAIRAREKQGVGHAFTEHRDVTVRQLDRRVTSGVNARGRREKVPVRDATRWHSDDALIRTADAAWRSDAGRAARERQERKYRAGQLQRSEMKFTATVPLRDALGPEWRVQVEGRSVTAVAGASRPTRFPDGTRGFACWRMGEDGRWYLVTCFPKP